MPVVKKQEVKKTEEPIKKEEVASKVIPIILVGTKSDQFSNIIKQYEILQRNKTIKKIGDQRITTGANMEDKIMRELNEPIHIESEYDQSLKVEMSDKIEQIMEEFEILNHYQCSSLTGDYVKAIFDEAVIYMLKVKSGDL